MHAESLPDLNFDGLSEADIREEILAPIIRNLGYRSGTQNNVLREKLIQIRYPNMFLGRKKPDKDPVLRGRPDYICEARGIARWAIEAKPPLEEISHDDIEQAHSYSVHPELAAPIFVLSNGKEFLVFESNRGPAANPILSLSYADIQQNFFLLSNLLSPQALKRRYPVHNVDFEEPLIDGLGSRVRIAGGYTRYDAIETFVEGLPPGVQVPQTEQLKKLVGFEAAIVGRSCYRDNELGIVADVEMHFPHAAMRQLFDALNLTVNQYSTRDVRISQNVETPTIFEYSTEFDIPKGTSIFDITSWSQKVAPVDVKLTWYAEAIGHFNDKYFLGTYSARLLVQPDTPFGQIKQWLLIRGSYELEIEI